jgi:hypothetical protein
MENTYDVPIYDRIIVDEDKQNFIYPDEKEVKFDIDELWKDENVTTTIKTMMMEFIHLFVQLNPLQQQIVSILVTNPGIKFGELCKKIERKHTYTHAMLIEIGKYEEFRCLLPGNVGKRVNWRKK